MKVNFYTVDVSGTLDSVPSVLSRIAARPLRDREREIGGKPMFLERYDQFGPLHAMDFTQRRLDNGPGYSVRGLPTTDFTLGANGGFGEQTAAIWSSPHYLAVQYNHYGVRPSAIGYYLSLLLRGTQRGAASLELTPVIDPDVFTRLYNSVDQTMLNVAFQPAAGVSSFASDDQGFNAMMRMREDTNAGKMELTLSLGQGKRGGPLQGIREMVQRLNRNPDVTTLKAKVRDVDGAVEVLDFLNHREMVEIPDDGLRRTHGRRLEYDSRVQAMQSVFTGWLQNRPPEER